MPDDASLPRDEAGYLILDADWLILAADESSGIAPDAALDTLAGASVRAVIGSDALEDLRREGAATFTLDNVEWLLTVNSFDLPGGIVRVVRAQEIQATIEHVVSLLVHEVRNPLSAMRALVQGLEEVAGDQRESTAYITRLTDEIDRLSRLLISMAHVARLRARPPELLAPVRVLERVAATFQPELARRGMQIQVSATPRVGPVLADPDQVQQLLVNLVTNAADAMPHGGMITLRARLDPRGRTVLAVEDTGIGMTPEEIERALRPRHSSKPGGMGLGLTVVRGIVRQLAARMRVTSSPGKGTSVAITFPVPTASAPVAAPPATEYTGD
ncbi:MAG TPA: HAMP domain-containing sensor histidine kinase [Ktedonobacterales bacterium]|nr:HAMP domain-containing sensor histidine kinase [Ktedonobacterales bacterium]